MIHYEKFTIFYEAKIKKKEPTKAKTVLKIEGRFALSGIETYLKTQ